MQIVVDTSKDSPSEIRKVIRFLQSIVGESTSSSIEPSEPQSTPGFVNIFGDNDAPTESASTQQSEEEESAEDSDVNLETY